MDIKKVTGFDNLIQPTTGNAPAVGNGVPPKAGPGQMPSFRDTLDRLNSTTGMPGAAMPAASMPKPADGVKFSNHAIERMQTRGIKFGPEDLGRLNDAVSRAAAKGSKDSLILMNDSALIVSVKNKTVVTVMDKNALKENVFTNIDSTIVM